ncbi:hypothetical protein PspLS_01033 [Pyricularia sp. CBS 133598]|nr:hypothetical protein PspLS_01033 [Pyricularia sp. CBS 133598]
MQLTFIAITLGLTVTSVCAVSCNVFTNEGQAHKCTNPALPVLCEGSAALGAFGGCCPKNKCGA